MAIQLHPDAQRRSLESIKVFFEEHFDESLGDLKARLVLDFVLQEICPTVYNQAIADAQTFITDKASDLEGSCYEPEFAYWKK